MFFPPPAPVQRHSQKEYLKASLGGEKQQKVEGWAPQYLFLFPPRGSGGHPKRK